MVVTSGDRERFGQKPAGAGEHEFAAWVQRVGCLQEGAHSGHRAELQLGKVHHGHTIGHAGAEDLSEPVSIAGVEFAANPQLAVDNSGGPDVVVNVMVMDLQRIRQ